MAPGAADAHNVAPPRRIGYSSTTSTMTEQSGRGVFPHSTGLAQDVWLVVATAVAYYLGALLGFALTLAPLPVAILWPPNAILMAGLFLAPKRLWPAVLAAVLIGHLASQF